MDHYGRKIPTHGHGTVHLPTWCSATSVIMGKIMDLYERITDPRLLVRRITLNAVVRPEGMGAQEQFEQLSLFSSDTPSSAPSHEALEREKRRQKAVLHIRQKFGKNAILKGMNYEEGATAKYRHEQIGGHKA